MMYRVGVNHRRCFQLKALHIKMAMTSPWDEAFKAQLHELIALLGSDKSSVEFLWMEIETSVPEEEWVAEDFAEIQGLWDDIDYKLKYNFRRAKGVWIQFTCDGREFRSLGLAALVREYLLPTVSKRGILLTQAEDIQIGQQWGWAPKDMIDI